MIRWIAWALYPVFSRWHLVWCRRKYHWDFGDCSDADRYRLAPLRIEPSGSIDRARVDADQVRMFLRDERALLRQRLSREANREG